MTDQRDHELDQLLLPLRGDAPSEFELRRWQSAVDRALSVKRPRNPLWQAVAASIIGGIVGAAGVFGVLRERSTPVNSCEQNIVGENFQDSATIEQTYTKLD